MKTQILKTFLWLVAIHSFVVGLVLILLPPNNLAYFGFEIIEKFFSTQGGVFHIVMSFAYGLAAYKIGNSDLLILFSIAAKLTATLFLLSYYIFKSSILIILFSGLGDFIMGILLLILYLNYKKA